MTYAVTKHRKKDQVKKAIDDTLKDNEKLYKIIEEYDEAKTRKSR